MERGRHANAIAIRDKLKPIRLDINIGRRFGGGRGTKNNNDRANIEECPNAGVGELQRPAKGIDISTGR